MSPATFDYTGQKEALDRKEEIVKAMLSGALSPMAMPQSGGPVASRVNPLQAVAKVLEGYMAGKQREGLEGERKAFNEQSSAALSGGIDNYMKTLSGTPAESASPGPFAPGAQKLAQPGGSDFPSMVDPLPENMADPTPVETKAAMPGNSQKAILEALASGHPVLQAMAMKQAEKLGEGGVTVKDLLAHATGASKAAMLTGGPAAFRPKRDIGDVGGILYDKEDENLGTLTLGGNAPQQKMVNGDLYELNPSTGQWKKLDNAPKISTQVSVSPIMKGESAFMEELGKQNAEAVSGANARKQSGQRMLVLADALTELEAQGLHSGPLAHAAMTVEALAQNMGMEVNKEKLAASESYRAQIAKEVAAVITSKEAGVGRSMSEGDRVVFERQFPQLLLTPQGRQQIVNQLRQAGQRDIKFSDAVMSKVKQAYPEAAGLVDVAPAQQDFPVTLEKPKAPRRYNPATRRLE